MSDLEILIEQMVTEIYSQSYQLDDLRLQLFLKWLTTHSVEMHRALGDHMAMKDVDLRGGSMQERFQSAFKTWLRSVPVQGLLWEYTTVITEIDWWRDLDPHRLLMMGMDMEN